ncbi:MAG: TIGR03085 family metal-binding protein [Acidimicrobiales bacterium]|nr:TIGR03085 family metal-binding protein [Acidimicrobiales bacterium]
MSMPHDARERAELCAHLDRLGPDAPTLCDHWTTEDLAAHLVARERNPFAGPGIVVGGPFARLTDWAMQRETRRDYATLVDRVRSGPPLVPWGLPVLRSLLNLNEYFVHHEDVRRANGGRPRTDRPELDDALRPLVSRMAALQLWRAHIDVDLVDDTGRSLARRGSAPPRIVGRPGELLLWLNGRGSIADVAFEGSEDEVSALWDSQLSI